jgi:hypothetical protein
MRTFRRWLRRASYTTWRIVRIALVAGAAMGPSVPPPPPPPPQTREARAADHDADGTVDELD